MLLVEFNGSGQNTVLWMSWFLETALKPVLKERSAFCSPSTGPHVLNTELSFQESFRFKKGPPENKIL